MVEAQESPIQGDIKGIRIPLNGVLDINAICLVKIY